MGDGRPDVEVCSVGGGGLLNGIMQAVDEKGWSRNGNGVEVLAMETLRADSLNQSLRACEWVKLARDYIPSDELRSGESVREDV